MTRAGCRLGALWISLAACTVTKPEPAASGAWRGPGEVPPNVLLVVIDTLGADHVDGLPPDARATPELDRFAAGGVAFRRAYSTASWTQPAVASLMTSKMPSNHGVLRLLDSLPQDQRTLAEHFHARGYRTAAVVSHILVGRRFGGGKGFDAFDESPVGDHLKVTSDKVSDAAIRELTRLARERFFLFVHYFDPHYVYNHHPAFDRTSWYKGPLRPAMDIWALLDSRPRLRAEDERYLLELYREEVAFTDAQLGRVFAALRTLGIERNTLVVVTADHGEEFNRHGWIGHTKNLYDDVLHVPLVVSFPGRLAARRIEAPVSLLDVAPTVLDLAGIAAVPGGFEGLSLADCAAGGRCPGQERELLAEVSFGMQPDDPPRFAEKVAFKTALRVGDRKLIHDLLARRWELFDRAADPLELSNLAAAGRAEESKLRARLLAWEGARRAPRASGDIVRPGPEDIERLRALGYVH
jgi:arylsulfatase A-like enzyme